MDILNFQGCKPFDESSMTNDFELWDNLSKHRLVISTCGNIRRYRLGGYKTILDTSCSKHIFIVRPMTSIVIFTMPDIAFQIVNNSKKVIKYCVKRKDIINSIFEIK